MRNRRLIAIVAALVLLGALAFFGYRHWNAPVRTPLDDIASWTPAETNAEIYIDLSSLRQSPFLAELFRWAPQPAADADYSQFVQSTGFDYEKDLNRVGIATWKTGASTFLFAVAEGTFDHKKISTFAERNGSKEIRGAREIFSVPLSGSARRITFTFLRNDLLVLSNNTNLEALLSEQHDGVDSQAWDERFRRLAGSPIFAVVRQDAAPGTALSSHAPGGLQSPQLSALVDQLQWITIAGKPVADNLRVVVEGESAADTTSRQLSDTLNGLLVLAQAGLNDPKMRQQLQPQVREAYLEMLKSADVTRIDRGETKSVRLILDLTPQFLEAARNGTALVPTTPQSKPSPNKGTIRN
ncbi:MAG TPA: hypothetical protein VE077_01305 [Candidatus Methylomirabilis sp.]|nr:hypothetical protein [Candidatus Methylomirabilis sp.]